MTLGTFSWMLLFHATHVRNLVLDDFNLYINEVRKGEVFKKGNIFPVQSLYVPVLREDSLNRKRI